MKGQRQQAEGRKIGAPAGFGLRASACGLADWLWGALGATVLAWLLLSGALLLVRAAMLATRPLNSGQAFVATITVLAAASFGRLALGGWAIPLRRFHFTPVVVTSVAIALWGVGLSGGNGAAAAIVWPLFLAEEGWVWLRHVAWFPLASAARIGRQRPMPNDRLVQQLTRTITRDGADVIRGRLTVCIDRGSRTAAGHVAFCPPFIERPSFEIEAADRTVATLKVSQLYSHGARVEARLPQLAEAETPVCIRFAAQARLAEAAPG